MKEIHPYSREPSPSRPALDARGILPKKEFDVGQSESLAAFIRDGWVFFTPALLYLRGNFSDAILGEFVDENPGAEFCWYVSRWKLFSGLVTGTGDDKWNYALWAIERRFWNPFKLFLTTAALVDPGRRFVVRYGYNELTVPDPLAADRRGMVLPNETVTVGAFGVDASDRIVALVQAMPYPKATVLPPGAAAVEFAEKLRTGKNPLL